MPDAKKIGRPTNDPKETRVTVRLNEKQSNILKHYCDNKGISLSQGIREAVENLE